MSEKHNRNGKNFKKVEPDMDSLIWRDEHFEFIVGYTSNRNAFGLMHEEWNTFRD